MSQLYRSSNVTEQERLRIVAQRARIEKEAAQARQVSLEYTYSCEPHSFYVIVLFDRKPKALSPVWHRIERYSLYRIALMSRSIKPSGPRSTPPEIRSSLS